MASTPLIGRRARIELTEREFERRLWEAGRGETEIRELWAALAADGKAGPAGGRGLAVGSAVAIYLGGLLVIAAFGLLARQYWQSLDPWGVLVLGVCYLAGFLAAGEALERRAMPQPADVLRAVGVCFVAVVVYAVERIVGLWPEAAHDLGYVHRGWTGIAIVGAVAAAALLAVRPSPLLVAPLAAAAIVLVQDLAELLFGNEASAHERAAVLLPFGLAGVALGLALDVRRRRAYATFVHVAAVGATAVTLGILMPETVAGYAAIGALGAVTLFFSLVVRHWSFAVAGGIGIASSVVAVIHRYTTVSASIVVSALGLLFIAGGLVWNAKRERVRTAALAHLPRWARELGARLAP